MYVDWFKFFQTFPNYYDNKIPLCSEYKETDNGAVIEVAVPGFKKSDFELYVEDGGLQLKINSDKKSITYSILGSYSAGGFNVEAASAEYDAGILKIEIPKIPKKKIKQISIKVS
jgi:HSP20 family molecular chaperone IbpA